MLMEKIECSEHSTKAMNPQIPIEILHTVGGDVTGSGAFEMASLGLVIASDST